MCECYMESVLLVVNADNCINSSKRKRASGLDNCKRKLGQCREELRLLQHGSRGTKIEYKVG